MGTFSPPTYAQPFLSERDDDRGIMRRLDFQVGYSVLINSGVASVYPGVVNPTTDDINAATAAFIGGHVYTVDSGTETILTTAGYTVT